jgi:hypothetical protein
VGTRCQERADAPEKRFQELVAGRQPHEPLWDAVAFFDELEKWGWDLDEIALQGGS